MYPLDVNGKQVDNVPQGVLRLLGQIPRQSAASKECEKGDRAFGPIPFLSALCGGPRLNFVERRVCEVHIPSVHFLLAQPQALTEISDLSKSPGAQCLQGFWGFFSGLKNVRTSPYFWLFVQHHAAISPINSNGSGLL